MRRPDNRTGRKHPTKTTRVLGFRGNREIRAAQKKLTMRSLIKKVKHG